MLFLNILLKNDKKDSLAKKPSKANNVPKDFSKIDEILEKLEFNENNIKYKIKNKFINKKVNKFLVKDNLKFNNLNTNLLKKKVKYSKVNNFKRHSNLYKKINFIKQILLKSNIKFKGRKKKDFLKKLLIKEGLNLKLKNKSFIKDIKYNFTKKINWLKRKNIDKYTKGKRIIGTNQFIQFHLYKSLGRLYTNYKNKKYTYFNILFNLLANDKFSYWFFFLSNKSQLKKELIKKKSYSITNKHIFLFPYLITIKPFKIIIKNIYFKTFFIFMYKNKWADSKEILLKIVKRKFNYSEKLLKLGHISYLNMLNENFFYLNKLFIGKNKILNGCDNFYYDKKKNNNKSLLILNKDKKLKKLTMIMFKNILKYSKKNKIILKNVLSEYSWNNLLDLILKINKKLKGIKLTKKYFNIFLWKSNNILFNKLNKKNKFIFFNFKNIINKFFKKTFSNYSFFLRMYILYFFWSLFFFNKFFYFFNKILFNLWFRFFYFLSNAILNINNNLFFSYKNLYKNLYKNIDINHYFEFENIFSNFLLDIWKFFYWKLNYILSSKIKKNIFKYFFLFYFSFIIKNYFFFSIYYDYNKYFKNVINKTFKLENNLLDIYYVNKYKYKSIYNRNYFLISKYIYVKQGYYYKIPLRKIKKLSSSNIIELQNTIQKRLNTLLLE